ncbi:potassium transporter Trk [Microbacterium sp. YY-01]|uniref:potassium transporter Trk n=1 Tax=Microbacterium sp. YY-01 TaxID=3421634 RepID=UPI003D17C44C
MSTPRIDRRDETATARVRRVPRYGVLMGIGAVVGLIAAGVITLLGDYAPSPVLDVVYPPSQVFGFALLWTVPVGIALGGLVGLLMERATRHSARVVRVDRERVRPVEEDT